MHICLSSTATNRHMGFSSPHVHTTNPHMTNSRSTAHSPVHTPPQSTHSSTKYTLLHNPPTPQQGQPHLYNRQRTRPGCLFLQARQCPPIRDHLIQIHHPTHNLHLPQPKLRPLCHQISIHCYTRTSIVIQSSTITAALVGVEIHAACFCGGALDELKSFMKFPQLVVAATAIAYYFHPC